MSDRSKRILFWSETFWPRIGGVENLAAKLLPALQQRGYEFAVVSWGTPDLAEEELYQGIPVYRFPFFPRLATANLDPVADVRAKVSALKRNFRSDLVHVNSYGNSVLFHLMTANAHPAPMIVTLHAALPDEPMRPETMLGKVLHTADWISCCSAAVMEQTCRLAPETGSRVGVIRNALEISDAPAPLPFDPPRLLCLGRLVQDKGFDRALTAFAQVIEHFPRARLIVAGDGPEREKLKGQARESGLIDAVEFRGAVQPEQMPDVINEATVVLIPSRLEGFGMVALEAAWMARPVVATRLGGLPEVVAHGETGLLIDGDDGSGFARAIISLLERPELARQMGDAARRRAREVFSWERHVNAYDELYRKLISDARQRAAAHHRKTDRSAR
jgi:glycogen(starch) synthase